MSIGASQYQDMNVETLSGTATLTAGSASVQRLDPGGAGRNVDLPDLGDYGQGKVVIVNTADAAEVITIRDAANSNATVGTPTQAESAVCVWATDGTIGGNGYWQCVVGAAS